MVLLDSFSYFLTELFDLLLLFILIHILTNIRSKLFLTGILLLLIPLTLISMVDALLGVIVVMLSIILFCFHKWKRNNAGIVFNDFFGILLSVLIYWTIPFLTSNLAKLIFSLKMDVSNNKGAIVIVVVIAMNWIFSLEIATIIKRKILNHSFSLEENKIFTMQLAILVIIIILFSEILRVMQALGVFSLIMLGFLVTQFSLTIYFTYLSVKKNQEKKELENLKEKMEMMNIYTNDVERNYQELRKFRHDYKNLLIGLNASQGTNEINLEYLAEMLDYSHQMIDNNVMRFSEIGNIQVQSVKSLIVTKLLQAEQENVIVHFECLNPISDFNLEEVKLVRMVGILMDNAIEAAKESSDKTLNVLLIRNIDMIEISIENSYKGKLPSFVLMHKKGFSSKGSDRGIGLNNLNEILSTTKQADITHYAIDRLFVSTLNIKKA
ncbi:GHKL domain-containing protein [Enterococcus faecalis]|uniref:GHKL domain-containing protein n=1 Tax=Enterococcus faecalis TaxID=1351 RepID=UPI003BB8A098